MVGVFIRMHVYNYIYDFECSLPLPFCPPGSCELLSSSVDSIVQPPMQVQTSPKTAQQKVRSISFHDYNSIMVFWCVVTSFSSGESSWSSTDSSVSFPASFLFCCRLPAQCVSSPSPHYLSVYDCCCVYSCTYALFHAAKCKYVFMFLNRVSIRGCVLAGCERLLLCIRVFYTPIILYIL